MPQKFFALIILNRIKPHLDKHLREQQHGFRPKYSCNDLTCVLKHTGRSGNLLEETNEVRRKLYFVDFEKAFGSVDIAKLQKMLSHYGIPGKNH